MIKEIKYTGFTATPSDYECPDGELDAAINLVPEEGELHPVQEGEVEDSLSEGEEVLLIHVVNAGTKHLIIKNGYSLGYRELGSVDKSVTPIKTFDTDDFKCSATGNVLCVYGVGSAEHFVFLYGEYRGFTPDKYAVSILFGISSSIRQNAQNITGILLSSGGEPVHRWDNIYTGYLQRRGTGGLDIITSFTAGKDYRFRVEPDMGTASYYVRLTFYQENGQWVAINTGAARQYFSFTLIDDAVSVSIAFFTKSDYTGIASSTFYSTVTFDESIEVIPGGLTEYTYNPDERVNTALAGVANTLLASIRRDNKFALPFFVRYGFRMITGDVVTVSPPILIEPSTGVVPLITLTNIGATQTGEYNSADTTAYANAATLKYKVRDLEKLQELIDTDDMIESLVIAVSEPIYMYKQGAIIDDFRDDTYVSNEKGENTIYAIEGVSELEPSSAPDYYLTLPAYRSYESLIEKVATFRILTEIKKEEISTSTNFVEVPIEDYKLAGLAGSTDIIEDNVEQLNSYDARYVMTYNQREHMLGVEEEVFGGFDLDAMCGYVGGQEHSTNYDVGYRQQEQSGVQHFIRGERQESSINRRWFYYPSTRAISASVYENGNVYNIELRKHDYLNGAFLFGGIGTGEVDNTGGVSKAATRIQNDLPNMLFVSAQANPFVIEQRIRVGDGKLLCGASNTEPISRGQYGGAPLYAFSTDGVWGIEMTQEGKYISRQPVTRDVCINIDSVTAIDKAVLFSTDRGIMLLSGSESISITDSIFSDSEFKLITPSLTDDVDLLPHLDRLLTAKDASNNLLYPSVTTASGIVPFKKFLPTARMLYDYVHQRIIVYNPDKGYAYIYSLKSKRWGMMESNIKYGINSYPECLAVDSSNKIINLSSMDTNDTRNCLLISRPLKMDAPDVLKTIDTIIQRGQFRKGSVKSILYGSRDLYHWHLVYSSQDHYLRGFRGTPYKYFRIALLCELKKDESLFGCTIQYNNRLTDQPR